VLGFLRAFFQVWGVVPAPGREFTPEEEVLNGPNASLLATVFGAAGSTLIHTSSGKTCDLMGMCTHRGRNAALFPLSKS